MTKAARCITGGALLLVLGLFLTIGWYFTHHSITHSVTNSQLRNFLIVDSAKAKGYNDWMQGNALENYNYYVYYAFNITNLDDVLAGKDPIYEQLGPYYYQYIWYNKNATWKDNGNIVEYNLVEDYIFAPEMSNGDPTKDIVTMFNPAFVTVLSTAGMDSSLMVIGTLPFIGSFINFCSGELLQVISSQNSPSIIAQNVQSIYSLLAPNFNNMAEAEQYFYKTWGGVGKPAVEFLNYPGMFPTVDNTSAIGASSVELLFSNTSYSLIDNSTASIMTWYLASNNENGTEAQILQTTFSLTPSQLHAVLLWRNSTFIPSYVQPSMMDMGRKYYPVSTWEDLGWVQFIYAGFTAPNMFWDIYGSYYPQFTQNYEFLFSKYGIGIGQAKMLFTGPVGILSIPNFGLISGVTNNDYSMWGIESSQFFGIEGYMLSLAPLSSQTFITNAVNSGQSGLFMTQTLDYWLWRCSDPIIEILMGPEVAYCGLQVNNSVQPPSSTYTGKDDITKLGSYNTWRNQSTVNYYKNSTDVYGWTDAGQFAPYVKEGQLLYIWDESFAKTLEFYPVGPDQIYDIDVIKYVLNESAFGVSELYTNTIEGFANITEVNQGAPIYLSNFDFYLGNSSYGNYTGVNKSSTNRVFIRVEPNTGATLTADEPLQVNLYYPPAATNWWEIFDNYTQVKVDAMYPLIKAYQISSISEKRAQKLKNQLKFFQKPFNVGILWGIFSFGVVLFIVGFIMIVFGIKWRHQHSHDGYNDIN